MLLILCSLGSLGTGATALWASTTQRHDGDIDLGAWSYRSSGYALVSTSADLFGATVGWPVRSLLGTVRIQVTPSAGAVPVVAGIAPSRAADRYLAPVAYDTVRRVEHHRPRYTGHPGAAPAGPPARSGVWTVRASGPGPQTLTWPSRGGSWTVAVMNADGSRPVAVRISVAAAFPSLALIAAGLLAAGILALTAGTALVVVPSRRAHRQ